MSSAINDFDETSSLLSSDSSGKDKQHQQGLGVVEGCAMFLGQMVGAGSLATSVATAQSGWIGLLLALFCCFLTWVSANMLGRVMLDFPRGTVRDFASVGREVFGRPGYILAAAAQYSLLIGASVIFVILVGTFMRSMICVVPARLFMLILGVLTIIVLIIFPALKKAKPIAVIAVLTMWGAIVLIVIMSMMFFTSKTCKPECVTCQTDIALDSLGSGFSAYSFAFSVHASIPNFFAELQEPHKFYRVSFLAYSSACFLFVLPLCIFPYLAFGRGLLIANGGTLLDAISFLYPASENLVIAARSSIVGHLLFALPIILTPVCYLFEDVVLGKSHVRGTRSVRSAIVRGIIVCLVVLVAMVLPYFSGIVSIVSDISVVALIYIFPPLFFWARFHRHTTGPRAVFLKIGLVLMMMFGLAGSALGLRVGIPSLIKSVETGGNPFAGFFSFGCGNSTNATSVAAGNASMIPIC